MHLGEAQRGAVLRDHVEAAGVAERQRPAGAITATTAAAAALRVLLLLFSEVWRGEPCKTRAGARRRSRSGRWRLKLVLLLLW